MRSGLWCWWLGGLAVVLTLGVASVVYLGFTPLRAPAGPTAPKGLTDRLRATVQRTVATGVQHYVEKRAVAAFLRTDLTPDQVIARFRDPRTPSDVRRLDAWRMAELIATPAAFAALEEALRNGAPEVRAMTAEALGHATQWPEAKSWLLRLLRDPDAQVATGAIRGLATLGDDESVRAIGTILLNSDASLELRLEVAERLGGVGSDAAVDLLVSGYAATDDEELLGVLVEGLGKCSFTATEKLFRDLVDNPDVDGKLRVRAVEALAANGGDALPFLRQLAATHDDPEVREAAAWTLGTNPGAGGDGTFLAQRLTVEPEADVRRRLYESLMHQSAIPLSAVTAQAETETDPAARIAAANAWALGLHQPEAAAAAATRFDEHWVPELRTTALSATSVNLRLRSVFALWRAGTSTAAQALTAISRCEEPKVAAAAQQALSTFGVATKP